MAMEPKLESAFRKCAKVVGWLSLALVRRSFNRNLALYYVTELRQAADILEGVAKDSLQRKN